jgi:NDP-sugar pyrophosphorylase family protein
MVQVESNKVNCAVILAGGLGKRIEIVSGTNPKPLLEIYNKPVLEWKIRYLAYFGIENIYVILGHKSTMVKAYLMNRKPFKEEKVFVLDEGRELLGTGGGLIKFKNKLPDFFYLTYADNLLTFDFNLMSKFANPLRINHVISITKKNNFSENGNIQINRNIVTCYGQNSKQQIYLDYGILYISKNALIKPEHEVFSLDNLLLNSINCGKVGYFYTNSKYVDIGTPENYFKVRDSYQEFISFLL